MAKMDKNAAKILVIFLKTVIQLTDFLLVEIPEDAFLELAAAFTGNDLHQRDAFINCLLDDAVQFSINLVAAVIYIVKVKF